MPGGGACLRVKGSLDEAVHVLHAKIRDVVHRHQHVAYLHLRNQIIRITVLQEEIAMFQEELLWLLME